MGATGLAASATTKNTSKVSSAKITPSPEYKTTGKTPVNKPKTVAGKVAAAGALATGGVLAASAMSDDTPPAKKLQTGAQATETGGVTTSTAPSPTPVPADGATLVAKTLPPGAQASGTGQITPASATSSTIGHSESEPMYVKQVSDDDGDDPDHPSEDQPEIADIQPGTKTQSKIPGIMSKVADSATAVYPGSMVGRAVEGGKTLLGKAKQAKDKAMSTETGQKSGKTLVGKAMATETGQKVKAVGTKALEKGKYFASQAGGIGSGLIDKIPGAATSMKLKASQATKAIKDKVTNTRPKKPIEPVKPKSFLGKIVSGAKNLVTEHPLVKLFRKKEETPESESVKPAKSQGLLSEVFSGAKQLGRTAFQGGKTLLGKTKQKITETANSETGQKIKAVGTKALEKGKSFTSQTAGLGMTLAGKAKQKAVEKTPGMLSAGKTAATKAAGSVAATARALPGVMKSKSQALKQTIDTKAKEPNSLLGGAASLRKQLVKRPWILVKESVKKLLMVVRIWWIKLSNLKTG